MNMRKIIAVLSAALLLCAAIPMGALTVVAAPGDVIIDADFESGNNGFIFGNDPAPTQSGALVLDGTSADWANVYTYANSIRANTKYVVTLRVKADTEKGLSIKINNGWNGGTQSQKSITVTTEWQELAVTLDGCPALDQGAIFTIQTPTYKDAGTVYYIDYVKVVEEPREAGTIVNGDFETGDATGWNLPQQGSVSAEAAHSGNYGIHIKGNGGWGGMLDQSFAIIPGKTYVVKMWVKVIANGVNIQIVDDQSPNQNHVAAGGWFTATEWTEKEYEFTAIGTNGKINFCGGGNGIAEEVYVDDITISEKKVASDDGFIKNGNFEIGETTYWNLPQQGSVSAEAAHSGNYGIHIKGNGGWGGMLDQSFAIIPGKTYVVKMWVKVIANGVNIQIVDDQSPNQNHVADGGWFTATEWTEKVYEFTAIGTNGKINFCGGGNGIAEEVYVDDIIISEKKVASDDGFIKNGDFETGEAEPWTLYSGSNVSADAAKDGNFGLHITHASGNWNGTAYQNFTVEIGKTYVVTMDAKAITKGQNIQIQDGGTVVESASKWFTTTEWTQLTLEFTATTTSARLNICGGGTNSPEEIYVDNVRVEEKAAVDVEAAIVNGDFETGDSSSWKNLYDSTALEIVDGRNGGKALKGTASAGWNIVYQEVAVNPHAKYTVQAYAKGANQAALWIKNAGGNGDITSKNFAAGSDWSMTSVTFDSGANTSVWVGLMGLAAGGTYTVDDIVILEGEVKEPPHELYNGGFETGDLTHWSDAYGSGIASIVAGYESGYAMQITNAGQWAHIRQDNIAVKPDTTYRLTAYVKDAQNMAFVVKTGDDNHDLTSHNDCIFPTGAEWQLVTLDIDTGITVDAKGNPISKPIDSICILVIAYEDGGSVIIDNVVLEEVVPCEHNYELDNENSVWPTCDDGGTMTYTCSICGDSYTEDLPAYHNGGMEYNPAKEAIDCANPGNIENYYCPGCNEYFADAYAQEIINPRYIEVTVDCVKPEGLADCAAWTCETCGNENYGAGEHDVVVCQGGICSKCNAEIEGVGCQNLDTPACEDGVCYYCGGFVAGFGHENGAWAPCLDGECSYGCGLIYPATEDHVDADADDYCDNCWNHLACIDEDADGFCDVCWTEMPAAEIVYGDVNGDSEIDILDEALLSQFINNWDVTLDEVAADVNCDGEIDILDEALLSQFINNWDVTLGPV